MYFCVFHHSRNTIPGPSRNLVPSVSDFILSKSLAGRPALNSVSYIRKGLSSEQEGWLTDNPYKGENGVTAKNKGILGRSNLLLGQALASFWAGKGRALKPPPREKK